MKVLVFLLGSLLIANCVFANSDQFEQIQSIEVFEVVEHEDGSQSEVPLPSNSSTGVYDALAKGQGVIRISDGSALMMTKNLIALGKEIYNVVEAGKPVVDVVEAKPVEVLPKSDTGEAIAAIELSGWKAPTSKKYKIAAKNYFGVSPVVFEFMVIFSYGGSLNGKGEYITGAQIKPTRVSVKWGYSFNASFRVQTIVNEGSYSSPIAGVVLVMDSKIKTVLQEEQLSQTFYINGQGKLNSY